MAVLEQAPRREGAHIIALPPLETEWTAPGFGPMARVATSLGDVPALALRERDVARSAEGDFAEIVQVDRLKLDAAYLAHMPGAHPVVIRAGALGAGRPRADIAVSAGQEIGIGHSAADVRFFRAGQLLGCLGILRCPEEMVIYTTFACERPVTVEVEGIWAKLA